MTPTELRKNIYKILDTIAETGKTVEIERKGKVFKIICEPTPSKLEKLGRKKRPKVYKGNSDEIIAMDWSKEWRAGHI